MVEPAPRFDIELPVELTQGQSQASFRGVSVNISETGMLVRAGEPRPRGTTLQFEFAPFRGSGEVIWTRPASDEGDETLLGVRFTSLKRQDRKTLTRILSAPPSLSST